MSKRTINTTKKKADSKEKESEKPIKKKAKKMPISKIKLSSTQKEYYNEIYQKPKEYIEIPEECVNKEAFINERNEMIISLIYKELTKHNIALECFFPSFHYIIQQQRMNEFELMMALIFVRTIIKENHIPLDHNTLFYVAVYIKNELKIHHEAKELPAKYEEEFTQIYSSISPITMNNVSKELADLLAQGKEKHNLSLIVNSLSMEYDFEIDLSPPEKNDDIPLIKKRAEPCKNDDEELKMNDMFKKSKESYEKNPEIESFSQHHTEFDYANNYYEKLELPKWDENSINSQFNTGYEILPMNNEECGLSFSEENESMIMPEGTHGLNDEVNFLLH